MAFESPESFLYRQTQKRLLFKMTVELVGENYKGQVYDVTTIMTTLITITVCKKVNSIVQCIKCVGAYLLARHLLQDCASCSLSLVRYRCVHRSRKKGNQLESIQEARDFDSTPVNEVT